MESKLNLSNVKRLMLDFCYPLMILWAQRAWFLHLGRAPACLRLSLASLHSCFFRVILTMSRGAKLQLLSMSCRGFSCSWSCIFTNDLSWHLTVPGLSYSPRPLHAFKTTTMQDSYTWPISSASMRCSLDLFWTTAPLCHLEEIFPEDFTSVLLVS